MTDTPMIFAIPSKGRLKEQVEAWLAECGFRLEMSGGSRGYSAELSGLPGVSVRLLSAGDIAAGLDNGELHLGVTGEDLLRERGEDMDSRVMLLRALGFGRADLVVTAPKSWLDVDTMADIDEVGHAHLAKTGRRLRVATKYVTQTRAFFARHGVADYRIVESSGATEGAPATLAANGLKVLSDGVILRSQAQLTASLITPWTDGQVDSLKRLLSVVEAKGRAHTLATLVWPAEQDGAGQAAVAPFIGQGARRANGALLATVDLFEATAALAAAGVEPVTVSRPDYVFESRSAVLDALRSRLER
jgi:ATP phosphoribosyltransferase